MFLLHLNIDFESNRRLKELIFIMEFRYQPLKICLSHSQAFPEMSSSVRLKSLDITSTSNVFRLLFARFRTLKLSFIELNAFLSISDRLLFDKSRN
jgi:hypothetical protein